MWCALLYPWEERSALTGKDVSFQAQMDSLMADAAHVTVVVMASCFASVYIPKMMTRLLRLSTILEWKGIVRNYMKSRVMRAYMCFARFQLRAVRACAAFNNPLPAVDHTDKGPLCQKVLPLVTSPILVAFSECGITLRPKFGELADGRLVVLLRGRDWQGQSSGRASADDDAVRLVSVLTEIERARVQKGVFDDCFLLGGKLLLGPLEDGNEEDLPPDIELPLELQNLIQSLVTASGLHVSSRLGREVVGYVLFSMLPCWVSKVQLDLMDGDQQERTLHLSRTDIDAESLPSRVYAPV